MSFRELSIDEIEKVAGAYWHSYSYFSSGGGQVWDREWIDETPASANSNDQDNEGEWIGAMSDQSVISATANIFDHARDMSNREQLYSSSYDSGYAIFGSRYQNANASDFYYHLADFVPFDATIFSPYSNGGSYYAENSSNERYVANMTSGGNAGVMSYNGVDYSAEWHPTHPVQDPNDPADTVYVNGSQGYWSVKAIGFSQGSAFHQDILNFTPQDNRGDIVSVATKDWGHAVGVIDPLTGRPVLAANGDILQWPSGINPVDMYNAGQSMGPEAAKIADPFLFKQNGYYDFQRSGSPDGKINHREFIDAATVGIGIFNAAAGVPIDTILFMQDQYAAIKSRYPAGTIMDSTYTHLPARNVTNTRIGYQLADHINRSQH